MASPLAWRRGFLLPAKGAAPAVPPPAAADAEAAAVRSVAVPLTGADADLDPLVAAVAASRASVVLIGEASHGTHEFYQTRAAITRRLIAEQGFSAVLLEADHPDTALLNAFVRSEPLPPPAHDLPAAAAVSAPATASAPAGGEPGEAPMAAADEKPSAVDALAGFQRFPAWMWRNADVALFLSWLRAHNAAALAATAPSGAAETAAPLPLRVAALTGCGMYGLDLYALFSSIRVVLHYLAGVDKAAHAMASNHYACFDSCGGDAQRYGADAALGVSSGCKAEAQGVLRLLQQRLSAATRRCCELVRGPGAPAAAASASGALTAAGEPGALAGGKRERVEEAVEQQPAALEGETSLKAKHASLRETDALFSVVEDARLVADAEAYYSSMFSGRGESWNVRDTHMHKALSAVRGHLKLRAAFAAAIAAQEQGVPAGHSQVAELAAEQPKVVVWAHNSHVGDARATEMSRGRGELNIGQLAREAFGTGAGGAFNIGFTTNDGTVTAAENWDAPARCMRVRPGLAGSYEELFHRVSAPAGVGAPPLPRFLVDLRGLAAAARADGPHSAEQARAAAALAVLAKPRLERAIGVIYRPETERLSHYFQSELVKQFDAVIHVDRSRAVEPMEKAARWVGDAAKDETYPTGL